MGRPRIRTIKPELWHDEKIGRLSRDERLTFIGLITLADDQGRFRALPAVILGHVFPYDNDAARRLTGWMDALVNAGMIRLYKVDGFPYGAIEKFTDHQKINRPTDSVLPDPSRNGHEVISAASVSGA